MRPTDPAIANETLLLAMAWGEHLDKPTQPRLAALYPTLTPEELDHYDTIARAAMNAGHKLVVKLVADLGPESTELVSVFTQFLQGRYPWASEETLFKLFSQGRYYAWHDGVGG